MNNLITALASLAACLSALFVASCEPSNFQIAARVPQTVTSAPATLPAKALSRDEQIQVLLFERMLNSPVLERRGRTVYVSVGRPGDSLRPSDAVMAAIAQHSYPIKPFSEYLKSIGGYDQWCKKESLIDVIWIGPLKWTDANTVEVMTGHDCGPRESAGQLLRIQLKDGQWHVESLGGYIT